MGPRVTPSACPGINSAQSGTKLLLSSRPSQRVGAKRCPMTGSVRAGTHSHRCTSCTKLGHSDSNNTHLWLWVAAFAGTANGGALLRRGRLGTGAVALVDVVHHQR